MSAGWQPAELCTASARLCGSRSLTPVRRMQCQLGKPMNGTLTVIHPTGTVITVPNLQTSMEALIQERDPFHCMAARDLITHPDEWLRHGVDGMGREFKCGGILDLDSVHRLLTNVGDEHMPLAHNDIMWLPEWLVRGNEVVTTQFTPWAIFSLETTP